MRFTSTARPALTPLGQRLLQISETKLARLEPGVGGRDSAVLLKEVVVRQAVKSAWKSVDQGYLATEMTNWKSHTAMGLDVIGEDEEEEEDAEGEFERTEVREERWFEDLITSFGEDDFGPADQGMEHEWTESNVASAFDDVEYEEDAMEAYTFPMSPPSPRPVVVFNPAPAPTPIALPVEVDVVEVDQEEDQVDDVEVEIAAVAHVHSVGIAPARRFFVNLSDGYDMPTPVSTPIQPTRYLPDCDEDDIDEYALPPPLIRSYSSSSDSSMCESDECVTPPNGTCEELEEEANLPLPNGMAMSMSFSVDMSMDAPSIQEEKVERGYEMTRRTFGEGWLGLRVGG